MKTRILMAAFGVALAVLIWTSDDALGQPRPPGPPMGAPPMGGLPRPPGPVMGPMGGPPRGIGGPGGIGLARPPGMMGSPAIGAPRPPGGIGAPPRPPGGMGPAGRPPVGFGPGAPGRPGGFGGPVQPGAFGPGGAGRPPVVIGPGGSGGPGRPPGGTGPGSPGRFGPGGRGGPGGPGDPPGIGRGGPGGPGGTGAQPPLPGLGGLGNLARSGPFAGNPSTVPIDRQTLANQADRVRDNFNQYGLFSGDWWGRYPGAWYAAGRVAGASAYNYPNWGTYSGYSGYSSDPVYYDYGSNVVYQGGTVYVNGDAAGTQEQYAKEATTIAEAGQQSRASKDEEWLPLGVFAMIQGEQVNGNDLFQLAVNKSGVIRGNYYNALGDTTLPVYGSVDRTTQRAAWTVGDRKEPVFEAGLANLTKSETTMLVHFGKGRAQQWTLVRINQSAERK